MKNIYKMIIVLQNSNQKNIKNTEKHLSLKVIL